jgi:homocysteine S-methyltransferase
MTNGTDSILLLDGATGTELDRRGVDVSLPLWSAKALLDAPDVVEQIHVDYLNAGAEAIITNSFRTHRRSLAKAGFGDRAAELTRLSVDIARSARDTVKPEAMILGSVAPLEDCYHPEWSPTMDECRREHAEMLTHLKEAEVDLVIIETVNTRHEALAAAEMAEQILPGRWIISFCMKTQGPPGVLLNGPTVVDILPALEQAYAVGVNCMGPPAMTAQVSLLRSMLPERTRIVAYGNIGHPDETDKWVQSDAIEPSRYADYVDEWINAGATIVGGCCGTTPETIRAVAERLGKPIPAASV